MTAYLANGRRGWTLPRGEPPATRHEALLARDDARALGDKLRAKGTHKTGRRRIAELLDMLHDLLVERIDRAEKAPSGRCEYCGHSSDAFDYDEGDA